MRKVAAVCLVLLVAGCSTMKSGPSRFPGIQDMNPNAVNRDFDASATRVAWAMTEVMKKDPIIDDVKLMVDPQSNESRLLGREEHEKLGIPATKITAHDMDFNIQAKSKDGQRIGVVIALKGEAGSEVSLLYGEAGEKDLAKALLDDVEAALKGPVKRPELWKADGSAPASKKAVGR